jgi:hypothetical protein
MENALVDTATKFIHQSAATEGLYFDVIEITTATTWWISRVFDVTFTQYSQPTTAGCNLQINEPRASPYFPAGCGHFVCTKR